MDVRGVLTEGFGRITELYADLAGGLDDESLLPESEGYCW